MNIMITGMGSYVPRNRVTNVSFSEHSFYESGGKAFSETHEAIARKFKDITGISERRYADNDQLMSDMAVIAGRLALEDAKVDPETLDGIILAHTCGNVPFGSSQADILPAIASRIKHELRIKNPACIAYDVIFGCPGWVQGLILARQSIIADNTKRFLVIGAETLSRVIDPHDRDSMIYADGAGAGVVELVEGDEKRGIISTAALTYTYDEFDYLSFNVSNKEGYAPEKRYLKMQGKKIYEFALKHVPGAMKTCFDKSGYGIKDLKKIFIHQANEKMDKAIIREFYRMYNLDVFPEEVLPMNIHLLGNSSVATIPTLLDMVLKNQQADHSLTKGDVILFASVGAGMNVNAVTYVV
ncbi:3-oxoacyl-ACP synthase [Sphingobacteriaceae bacterium]|nr:3-oxoacyl-ACP synthase [Sphingobacteriaceae bacterium]